EEREAREKSERPRKKRGGEGEPRSPTMKAPQGDDGHGAENERERVTPTARRMAEEHGVDLGRVTGSGEQGRIVREDVKALVERLEEGPPKEEDAKGAAKEPSSPRPRPERYEERRKMSSRRRTIARRLVEAQRTAAMLTTFNEIDMAKVMDLRKRHRESFESRHGIRLGIVSFFVQAVIGALKNFPLLNAEVDGEEIVMKSYYDVGIAVGAKEGLVVPVLRDADRMSLAEIEKAIKDFARRAEEGRLTIEDIRGGTFTLTNGGVFGSLLSTPLLNPPQVGILGLHKIEERPVVVEGKVAVKPMMYVALSYDHRIVDGLEAVQFLVRVKELIEEPEELLLEG
ncbi:MAG: 2-oxoglutarate dehydrogenase complex dihydrolipoyllysine-residue succinyltransferase, partial [Vicinamibacteria bacterium]